MSDLALIPPFMDDLEAVFDTVGEAAWETLRGSRLFMTGGTGFVGKWLLATVLHARRRLSLDNEIIVLSRRPGAFAAQAPFLGGVPGVRLVTGDLRDAVLPTGRFDFIVHAATDVANAESPLDTFDCCVTGTRRVLDLAREAGTGRVLLVSSGALYGAPPMELAQVSEDHRGAPDLSDLRSAYGEGKRVSEWLGVVYSRQYGIDVRAARCFAFVGPYLPLDRHFAIGNFLRSAMARESIVLNGDGTPLRTYLYAADMAAWLWALLLRGPANATFNVGSEEVISIGDLARRTTALLGSDALVEVRGRPTAGMAPDRYVPDVSRIRQALALPSPRPLDEALTRTAAWFRAA